MSEMKLPLEDESPNKELNIEELPLKYKIKEAIKSIPDDREKQIKIGILSLMIILIALDSQLGIFSHPPISESCFTDNLLIVTKSIAKYYREHSLLRDVLNLGSTFCIDIIFLYSGIRWIFFEDTWRLLTVIIVFYGIRAVVQSLYIMKFDEEYYWKAPPIKSLMVSYLQTNDYFFSGHVALPLIIAYEFFSIGQPFFAIPCFFISAYQGFVVIISRSHYSIDIFAGFFAGHYFFIIGAYWEKILREAILKRMKKDPREIKTDEENEKEKLKNLRETRDDYTQKIIEENEKIELKKCDKKKKIIDILLSEERFWWAFDNC